MGMLRVIDQVVLPALVVFVLAGSIAAVALGVALMMRSEAALRFIGSMNTWVSTRRVLRPLEIPRSVEGAASRRPRWLGALILGGGIAALYLLLARPDLLAARSGSVFELKRWLLTTLPLQAMTWFLVLGAVFAMAAGALLLALPRAWRAFEERMNHWYSTRRLVPAESDRMHTPLDALVEAHPRVAGAIIAAASIVVALAMAGLLLR